MSPTIRLTSSSLSSSERDESAPAVTVDVDVNLASKRCGKEFTEVVLNACLPLLQDDRTD